MISIFEIGGDQLKLITKVENAHEEDINCIKWGPEDNTLASACDDGTIKIWNFNII
jgi:WD40 repeat protein